MVGLAVLLYGTAIYNAPNSGSLLLKGNWYGCGLDYSEEYPSENFTEIEAEVSVVALSSPFLLGRSPFLTPSQNKKHTTTPAAQGRLIALNSGAPRYTGLDSDDAPVAPLKKTASLNF